MPSLLCAGRPGIDRRCLPRRRSAAWPEGLERRRRRLRLRARPGLDASAHAALDRDARLTQTTHALSR